MSFNQSWHIHVKGLEVNVPVGIYDHERTPQRIMVEALIEADYSVHPVAIEECLNYEHIYTRVKSWEMRSHTPLLETYVTELLTYIFTMDTRVTKASVTLAKPDIFPEVQSVGVGATWTRGDFERFGVVG